jgi:DNA-binding transcriptional regulator LsrR (DeoR family)
LVEITVHTDTTDPGELELELNRRFRIRSYVVPMPAHISDIDRLDRVSVSAARLLNRFVDSHMTVGLAWGSTITAVSKHLVPKPTRETVFIQLNGSGNTQTTGISYASEILSRFASNYGAAAQQFPVPTLFDDPATKAGMWRERSTLRVLEQQRRMSLAVFSIGSPLAKVPSQVYAGGYLDEDDRALLEHHHVVGDLATIFYRVDGTFNGIPLNARSSGPEFNVLRRTPRRLCIAADVSKNLGIRGALAAELITDLVVDSQLARALVE